MRLRADAGSVWLRGRARSGVSLSTGVFPAFPTDLQAVFMALMAAADGRSELTESVFENRFGHVPELRRMGARIELDGSTALVEGGRLRGASVEASDLRAGAALVVAALCASGTTRLHSAQILRRGYEDLEGKLNALGADISVNAR